MERAFTNEQDVLIPSLASDMVLIYNHAFPYQIILFRPSGITLLAHPPGKGESHWEARRPHQDISTTGWFLDTSPLTLSVSSPPCSLLFCILPFLGYLSSESIQIKLLSHQPDRQVQNRKKTEIDSFSFRF